MKKNNYLLLLCLFISTHCISQSNPKDTLKITDFNTQISVFDNFTTWYLGKAIDLLSPPTRISITIKDQTDSLHQNLICILREEIKMHDTLRMGNNPTLHLFNLSGGQYKVRFVNLSNQHYTELPFSIEPVFWEKWWFSPFIFLVISIILGLLFYFFYLIRLRQQLQLQAMRHELEIKALRAQMNPHFIFNSMNTIDAYILRKRFIEASDCLQKFSKLIRRILENSENQTISISQEIETLKLYIELEQERFSHSFDYRLDVAPVLLNQSYQIPPLLIQPFVENALLHGIRHLKDRSGEIIVTIAADKEMLHCTILDNGIGRKASAEINKQRQNTHKSMGMNVTLERISTYQALYGDKMETRITDLPEGTKVEIKLPLVLA